MHVKLESSQFLVDPLMNDGYFFVVLLVDPAVEYICIVDE